MVLKPDPTTAGYDAGVDGVPVNMVQSQVAASGGGGTVNVADKVNATYFLVVDTNGKIAINNTAFKVTDKDGTNQLVIDSNGKIGINNSSFAVTNTGLSNIDTALNALFTTTGIKVATAPSTAVTNTGLSNIDTALNALFTTTGIKVATAPSTAVTNTGLSNIDTALNALFTTTGIKVATLPAISDAVLTACEDQTTHYLGTKDVGKLPITGTLQNAATGTGYGTPLTVTGAKLLKFQVVTSATSFTLSS